MPISNFKEQHSKSISERTLWNSITIMQEFNQGSLYKLAGFGDLLELYTEHSEHFFQGMDSYLSSYSQLGFMFYSFLYSTNMYWGPITFQALFWVLGILQQTWQKNSQISQSLQCGEETINKQTVIKEIILAIDWWHQKSNVIQAGIGWVVGSGVC